MMALTDIPKLGSYIDSVLMKRDYDAVGCFEYLDAMLASFQSSDIYRPNALEEQRGSLSWGASLVGRSYLRMYEKTANEKYLRGFVGIGEQILLARDDARGVADYLGVSGPVWRSGRPYTTNSIAFSCGALEVPCIEVRAKQSTHLELRNTSHGATAFDISFLPHPQGPAIASFGGVNTRLGTETNLKTVLTAQHWKSPQAAAVISHDGCMVCLPEPGIYELEEKFYAPAVHVSQICTALLEFSRMVCMEQGLSARYGEYSARYVEAAIAALNTYEPDYRVREEGGYYIIPADAPHDFEGTDAPQNHNMSMALCFLLLFRITGKEIYKTRAAELLRTFRNSQVEDLETGSRRLVWSYFIPGLQNYSGYHGDALSRWRDSRTPNTRMEDMSHAVLAVEAAVEAFHQGVEVTARDLQGMANTFVEADASGSLSNYVDGSAGYGKYDNIAGRWAVLGPWDSRVYTTALAVLNTVQPQPTHASVLLSCANLVGNG